MQKCALRNKCMVTTNGKDGIVIEKPRSELDIACGFEQAGTIKHCPKRRKLGGSNDKG